MAAEEQDTERTSVKTYVPAYQRDEWDDHAAELDMSRSEFVRSMVQAGRKGFDPRGHVDESASNGDSNPAPESETGSPDLESFVRRSLGSGPRSWDELHAALIEDVEADLEETLDRLQERNVVRYSGRDGGYTFVE